MSLVLVKIIVMVCKKLPGNMTHNNKFIVSLINAVCNELPRPASGVIQYSNNRSIGSTASYLNFQCNMGFELKGELILDCSENGWEGQTPYCSKYCTRPSVLHACRTILYNIIILACYSITVTEEVNNYCIISYCKITIIIQVLQC